MGSNGPQQLAVIDAVGLYNALAAGLIGQQRATGAARRVERDASELVDGGGIRLFTGTSLRAGAEG
jgi:hypothetical protein